ncbi:MAG TPA: hypothetical protein VG713_09805 [Pirellulales bacterium]|nr:hypothetical protein [Pirellulales bacterium]
MTDFNISDSKIEQANSRGDNYKVTGNSAPVAISGRDAVQAGGGNSKASLNHGSSLLAKLWRTVKTCWAYFFGTDA